MMNPLYCVIGVALAIRPSIAQSNNRVIVRHIFWWNNER